MAIGRYGGPLIKGLTIVWRGYLRLMKKYLNFLIMTLFKPDFPYQTGCTGKLLWYNSFKSLLASFIRWGWLECEGGEVDNQY